MRTAQLLVGAAALTSQAAAICFFPEPAEQICYNVAGATPQNLDVREVAFIAKYLRNYQTQAVKQGLSPFWRMTEADADGCAEWQVTTKGGTWALAKLVGDDSAAVTFNDIATTIDGGVTPTAEDVAKSLTNCGTAGGQMGVIVNTTDPLYSSAEFVDGGFSMLQLSLCTTLIHKSE